MTYTERLIAAMLVGGMIVAVGLVIGAATQSRAAGSAPTVQWAGECTVLGCGRTEV